MKYFFVFQFFEFLYVFLKPPMYDKLESIYVVKVISKFNSRTTSPIMTWNKQAAGGFTKISLVLLFNYSEVYFQLTEAYYVQFLPSPYSSK